MHCSEVDGVKVFQPTFEEFQDFGKCVREIERQGAAATGLAKVKSDTLYNGSSEVFLKISELRLSQFVKVIPPKEWMPRKDYTSVEEGEFSIPAPISQVFQGRQG